MEKGYNISYINIVLNLLSFLKTKLSMTYIRTILSKIMIIFGFIMVSVYILLGVGLLTLPYFETLIDQNVRIGVALFLMAYGSYRLFRQISKLRTRDDDNKTIFYERE
jgi:hypothetical protein